MTRRVDPLERLADLINEDKKVVIITGAGLSAASGVPVFRGGDDAIWVQRATTLGTKSAFLRDTIRWYNTFWFPFFRHEYTRFRPNDGHEGIARLANLSSHITVVTQNIDSLHQQTRTCWSTVDQLIEVHGRLGLYHCSSEHGCELATETFARAHEVFPHMYRLIEEGSGKEAEINELPLCPQCLSSPIMPLALMFDEDYTSHAFYQFDRAMDSFESADVLVFVGTSFSVNITSLALSQARQKCIPVFNFNLKDALNGTGRRYEVFNVMGPSEEKLKQLADLAEVKARPKGGSSSAADVSVSAVAGEGDIGGSNSSMIVGGKDEEGEGERGLQEQQHQLLSSSPPRPPQHREDVKEIHHATTNTTTMAYELDPAQPSLPLSQEQVDVVMHFRYARKVHPELQMEASIHHIWMELQTKNPSLFNGSKFRLAKCELFLPQDDDVAGGIGEHDDDSRSRSDGESSKRTKRTLSSQQQRLVLHLWLTDYKTFRGTNWHPSVATLIHDGLRDFQNPHAYLSQKLGVNAAVCTSDGFVILIRRSQAVAEGQGLLDVPGGHPEPQHLGLPPPSNIIAASTIPPLPTPFTLPSNQVPHPTTTTTTAATTPPIPSLILPSNQDIVNEIFHSAAQEVVDEINIPSEKLGSAQLLGIVRQRNSAGCPNIAFLIPCFCTLAEVLEYYQAGPKEADESTELVWVGRDQIATIPSQNLTPSAQGCLDLLNQLVPLSST